MTTQQRAIIFTMALCQFLTSADVALVGMALPQISNAFGVGAQGVSWVVSANALVSAGFLILGGRVTDVFGQRSCLIASLSIYIGGTLVAIWGPSFAVMIAGRAVQGLGLAVFGPASLSLIATYLPEGPVRHRAWGWYGIMQGMSMVVGLVCGGMLAEWMGWRSVIALTLPFSSLSLILTLRSMPPPVQPARPQSIGNPLSSVIITMAVTLFVYAGSEYGAGNWTGYAPFAAFILSIAGAVLFVQVDRRSTNPLLPRDVLTHRKFVVGCLLGLLGMAGVAPVYLLPNIFMQSRLAMSASSAGLGMLPMSMASFLSGYLAPALMHRFTLSRLGVASLASCTAGVIALVLFVGSPSFVWSVAVGSAIIGFGWNLTLMSVMGAAMAPVPVDLQGTASGLIFMAITLGIPMGDAISLAAYAGASQSGSMEAAFRTPYCVMAFLLAGCVVLAALGLLAKGNDRQSPARVIELSRDTGPVR